MSENKVHHKESHNSPPEPSNYLICRATSTAAALYYIYLCMLWVKMCFCLVFFVWSKIHSNLALKCSGGQNVRMQPQPKLKLAQRSWLSSADIWPHHYSRTHIPNTFKTEAPSKNRKYSSWWKSARLLIWAHKSLLTFRCYQEPAVLWSTCVTLKTNHDPISQPPRLLYFSLHGFFFLLLPRELFSCPEWNSKCPL